MTFPKPELFIYWDNIHPQYVWVRVQNSVPVNAVNFEKIIYSKNEMEFNRRKASIRDEDVYH